MTSDRLKTFLSYLGNSSIVVLLIGVTLALRKGSLVVPAAAGFFCGDQSIRLPIKEEAISTNILLAAGTISVLIITSLTEYFRVKAEAERVRLCGIPISRWVMSATRAFSFYLFGLCITALFVELGKVSTGILRPNFFAVCQPNITCETEDPNKFQAEYRCLRASEEEQVDGRKSFPSGHAAVVAFMAFYLGLYLQQKSEAFEKCFLVRPVIQLTAMTLAWVTSLTRISDYVHHVSDVVVGFALGAVLAVWAVSLAMKANWEARERETVAKAPMEICLEQSIGDFKTMTKENLSNSQVALQN